MARSVPALLPYTLLKIDDTPQLVFLLWRDRRSTAVESSTFWGCIVCPLGKDDSSPLDAVCRVASEKTKGQFAPATMVYESEHEVDLVTRKSPAKQRIEESRQSLRKKLKAGVGVTLLTCRQFVTYVAPVRFVPAAQLNASFGADKGEAEWISAKDLFAALYSSVPDNIVTVRAHPYETATTQSSRSVELPLGLPFTVSMRTEAARSELAAILKQFNVALPVETPAASAAASSASASAVEPSLSSLSLQDSAAASSAAVAATSTAAAPSAASSSSSSASSASSAATDSDPTNRPAEINYTCRKCRSILFTDLALSAHTMPKNGGGRFAHKHIKLSEGGRRVGVECSSLFVEPLKLSQEYPEGEGPLLCAKCQTRWGNYSWSGQQCSCGEWIIPAFQAVKSKVDERIIGGVSKVNHIAFQFQRPPPRVTPATAAADASAPAAATAAPAVSEASESKAQPAS